VVLFSDVDGTLLDANDRLALTPRQVASVVPHVDLVLASSRTLVELAVLQRRLGISGPMIGENGAVVSFPAGWRGSRSRQRQVTFLGERAASLVPGIHRCADQVGVRVVNQKQLLPDRGKSIRRGYSVCLRDWPGQSAVDFIDCLTSAGLEGTRSGQWITITSGPDKGTAVRAVLARAKALNAPFRTVGAIGNAANDAPLLKAARIRLAVRNRNGHNPELCDIPGVQLLPSSGARAWREVLPLILPTRTT
jgi:mannosyl-3-phosphoglycerate phosphatase